MKKSIFKVKDVDTKFYKENLQRFLPNKIIDIHNHIYLKEMLKANRDTRKVTWPSKVAEDNSMEDLIETYNLMFPDKDVKALTFGLVGPGDDIVWGNNYVEKKVKEYGFYALYFTSPKMEASELENAIENRGFLGSKVYLDYADPSIKEEDIEIFDFVVAEHLEVLNKHKAILMLHIPRPGRLGDPVNLVQLLEIEEKYPDIKLIVAHVGRAYCNEDVGDAFNILKKTKKMMFDFSANTNSWVFEQLIKCVGPKRILFGSDLPILRMRTKRTTEGGIYVNNVPKGLYGDVSNDSHMREIEGEEAKEITFMLYEEIYAFKQAAEKTGLTKDDIEDVFYNNAIRLVGKED